MVSPQPPQPREESGLRMKNREPRTNSSTCLDILRHGRYQDSERQRISTQRAGRAPLAAAEAFRMTSIALSRKSLLIGSPLLVVTVATM